MAQYLLRWCKGTHDRIGTRALAVCGAKALHHTLQAHAFQFRHVCLCITEENVIKYDDPIAGVPFEKKHSPTICIFENDFAIVLQRSILSTISYHLKGYHTGSHVYPLKKDVLTGKTNRFDGNLMQSDRSRMRACLRGTVSRHIAPYQSISYLCGRRGGKG